MTLVELLKKADEGYPDDNLDRFFTPEGKLNEAAPGNTLARFIVSELRDTFEPSESDEEQLGNAVGFLQSAADDLFAVIGRLEEIRDKCTAKCPKCGEERSVDCYGDYRCEVCDKPCPGCYDGGGPV